MDLSSFSDTELISAYASIIKLMKARGIIRSGNVVGDLGDYLAIDFYCKTPGLPKLQLAPPGTQNIDAISINGERYSIKSTTGNVTGVFYGLNPPGSEEIDLQKFEYVLIVLFDKDINLVRINELTWDQFMLYKRWHSRMQAWNLSVTKDMLAKHERFFDLFLYSYWSIKICIKHNIATKF